MNKKAFFLRAMSAGAALWLAMLACDVPTTRVNELKTETKSVELGEATTANVQIEFGAGTLKVAGDGTNLMDATFSYNVDDWQPEVNYTTSGQQGTLSVHQGSGDKVPVGANLTNDWAIKLNNQAPIDLLVRTGAGNSDLELNTLNLTGLKIETGAGVTTVDLNGNWDQDLNVSITGGVGQLEVNLPAEMGVRVNMGTALVSLTTKGLDKNANGYVNKAYGAAPYTLTLDLQAGVGAVVLSAP